MNKKFYYVYRYVDNDGVVLYVGYSICHATRELCDRVYEHMNKDKELHEKCCLIEYVVLPNEAQMHQYEVYYINLWKPEFNDKDKDLCGGEPVPMPELSWIMF